MQWYSNFSLKVLYSICSPVIDYGQSVINVAQELVKVLIDKCSQITNIALARMRELFYSILVLILFFYLSGLNRYFR
ncbi:hypothetical protein CDG77_28365 [Nostoc sp. 'Peltigera membranacea cyanobiont' 213]|nr:hypothetical protein CDG77_28365 [Nostoc sp. 'Peltigera membranacea cyanobiont' 213]